MSIHIGTSGWSYDHWQGVLYPERTPGAKRLGYYLPHFDTVEVNNTFYRWPKDETFAKWRDQLPDGFQMAVKAPKWLTHNKKLNEPDEWIDRVAGGVTQLEDRFRVLLVQLPPQWGLNFARLEYFLKRSPPWLKLAIEFRHPSWNTEEVFQLLETHNAAYCVMSGAHLPCILRATSNLVYIRFHGPDPQYLYAGSYSENDLHWWAERIREWKSQGRDVLGYFNNDGHGFAVHNARRLKELVG